MKFLIDNCIRQIKSPIGPIISFDYSSELNLIASFEDNLGSFNQIAYVWNPDTSEVVEEIDVMQFYTDILFLPGRYIAIGWEGANRGRGVVIYSMDSGEEVFDVTDRDLEHGDCDILALTPENNLLVGGGFYEFKLDYKNMKVLEKPKLIHDVNFYHCFSMCCSRHSYTILYAGIDDDTRRVLEGFVCVNVEFSSSGEVETSQEIITHCFIDGEKREFGDVFITGLAHDGDNIIVATRDEIIVLESATDGSIGHVIVSSGITPSKWGCPSGNLLLTDNGQLMVSNCSSDIISVYKYKEVNTLQGLCRRSINSILKQRKANVADLPLPNSVKNYLSYKV